MPNYFCMISIQGRELNFADFIKNMFETGWRSDTYRPISLELGTMIDTTDLHFDISLNDIDFT